MITEQLNDIARPPQLLQHPIKSFMDNEYIGKQNKTGQPHLPMAKQCDTSEGVAQLRWGNFRQQISFFFFVCAQEGFRTSG